MLVWFGVGFFLRGVVCLLQFEYDVPRCLFFNLFWYLSCLVFSDLPGSVVFFLS